MTDMRSFRAAVHDPHARLRTALRELSDTDWETTLVAECDRRRDRLDLDRIGNRISRLSLNELARNMLAGVRR